MQSSLTTKSVIAVIGAGAMGAGIAQVAAVAGHPVKLYDARDQAAEAAVVQILKQLEKLSEKGKISADVLSLAQVNLQPVERLEQLHDATCVIEAIVEDVRAKQELYKKMESFVGQDCIFATNTSSISITAIGSVLDHPERLAGFHFFNPAPIMKLVEVVSGLATSPEVATTLYELAKAWGKTPVYAKSTPGFIVNRVARSFYSEALRLLHEGVTDMVTLDTLMRDAGGFRMGPFELMDMIGLDINFSVTQSVWNAFFNDPRFTPSLLQQEYVAAGWLGRKTKRGFYDYAEGALQATAQFAEHEVLSSTVMINGDSLLGQALLERLPPAQVQYAEAGGAQTLRGLVEVAGARVFITDGRTATNRAVALNYSDVIVVDLAADYKSVKTLAIAASLSCSQEALRAVIALFQAAGIQVCLLKDVPGLPVMRTLSTLANEAADAVNQGVAQPEAIDIAMRLGVGYPRGPLEWAREVGFSHIKEVLTNLAMSYGEDKYRLSPWLDAQVGQQILTET